MKIACVFLATVSHFFLLTKADKYLTQKPSFLMPCKINDSNLSQCLTGNFQILFVQWKDGLPGLSNVGKLDPMHVKRVKIVQDGSRAVALSADLQNVVITGASKGIVKDTRLDTKTWQIHAKIFIPKLHFDSDYKVKGNVLSLNLNSNGKAKFEAENTIFDLHLNLKLRDDGDLTFSEIENAHVSLKDIGGFHIHVGNLFDGQKELEEAANLLFNENWRELYESFRPAIEQTIGKILEDRLQKIFHYVPANYFIADIPKASEIYG